MGQKSKSRLGGIERVEGDFECLKEFKVISKWVTGEFIKKRRYLVLWCGKDLWICIIRLF